MPDKKSSKRVVVAASGDELTDVLRRMSDDFEDIAFDFAPQAAFTTLNGVAAASSAIVVEADMLRPAFLDDLAAMAESLGERKIIAAAGDASGEDIRRLFRAGAADVVSAPYSPQTLSDALAGVMRTRDRASSKPGQVVTFIKAGGGAGATTLALNLGSLLMAGQPARKQPPRRTAVLDLDLQLGDSDVALNLEPRSTIVDVLGSTERLDGRYLESVLSEHRRGLKVLAPSAALLPLDAMTARGAARLVEESSRLHDLTLVDLPGAWSDWTIPVLQKSDLLVLVLNPSVSSVLRARRLLAALEAAGVTRPVFILLNKLAGFVDGLEKPSRISRTLERQIDGTATLDAIAGKAADRGELVVDAYPKSRLAKDLQVTANAIRNRLAATAPAARAQSAELGAAA